MDKIIISGGKRLKGTVRISGSKNAALPIIAATLLTDEECIIRNVPSLTDITSIIALIKFIGKAVSVKGDTVRVLPDGRLKPNAPYDIVRKMRASVLVMGPLIARVGKVEVSLPGGCAIGARPIDIHLDAFRQLGAGIELEEGYVRMNSGQLRGGAVKFRFPSVGATENTLLAAVLAKGRTIIENAAREPEISDLADVLNKMGAGISGAGSSTIEINGVGTLKGFDHSVIPDRIEASTYLIAAAVTKGDVTLVKSNPGHIKSLIGMLKKAGLKVVCTDGSIKATWVKPLKPVNIKTGVYPQFPTDVQAQWMALMSSVGGRSVVEETVFENRFMHVAELQRLGADLMIAGNRVIVNGSSHLSGAPVMVSDLRAGAALIIAGLAAKGKTTILRVYHLDRGYENIEGKLRALGAVIRRVSY